MKTINAALAVLAFALVSLAADTNRPPRNASVPRVPDVGMLDGSALGALADERDRVKAGVIITNYETASSLAEALKANGDERLEKAGKDIIKLYEQERSPPLYGVSLYVPESFAKVCQTLARPQPTRPTVEWPL